MIPGFEFSGSSTSSIALFLFVSSTSIMFLIPFKTGINLLEMVFDNLSKEQLKTLKLKTKQQNQIRARVTLAGSKSFA